MFQRGTGGFDQRTSDWLGGLKGNWGWHRRLVNRNCLACYLLPDKHKPMCQTQIN